MEDHTLNYFTNINSTYIRESSRTLDNIVFLSVLPVEIIVGVLANSWVFAVIVRRRMWLQHEGFVYLAAILLTSALILALHFGSFWLWMVDYRYAITRKADFLCKAFNFFFNGFHCTGLLVLAMLFNVCLRRGLTIREGEENQASGFRPSICALISALSLVILTLLMNIWQLISFELQEIYDGHKTEYYCHLADHWYQRGVLWNWIAALVLHGLPIVFILPVLVAMIMCSGCACRPTGCKFGDNSREYFPRGILLLLAGIIYFLEFPSAFWTLFGSSLLGSNTYPTLTTYLFVAAFLVNGFALAVVPILCIITMPKLREFAFKAEWCSCWHRRSYDTEAIALRKAGQDN